MVFDRLSPVASGVYTSILPPSPTTTAPVVSSVVLSLLNLLHRVVKSGAASSPNRAAATPSILRNDMLVMLRMRQIATIIPSE